LKYHPDHNHSADATERFNDIERFKAVNAAYQVLSDPYQKSMYDMEHGYGAFASTARAGYTSGYRTSGSYR